MNERWKVLLSQRFDICETVTDKNSQFPPGTIISSTYSDERITNWAPRVGLIYEVIPGAVSTYAVYTSSFQPPSGGNTGPNPELGSIYEGGVKVNIFENLAFTTGGFWIERENASVRVSNNPLLYDQSGVQRSQGVELSLYGQWTDRLSTVSNYTYNDVLQSGYQSFVDGDSNGRALGVPLSLANIWTRYNVIQDRDRTLGAGLGWVYVGDRRGDYNSPLVLSDYNRFDLGFFGRLNRWTADAYIENIFNEDYDTGSISQFQVYPGAPANFRFQVGATF